MKRVSAAAFWFAIAAGPSFAADLPPDHQPKICVGYEVSNGQWGWDWADSVKHKMKLCPPGHALFGVNNALVRIEHRVPGLVRGACCPLPAEDILTAEEKFVRNECPDGYIITGGPARPQKEPAELVRCTKINSARYRLGPNQTGRFWGEAVSTAFPWKEDTVLNPNVVPIAIRYGLRRKTRSSFDVSGCVGAPVGSLLVAAGANRCRSYTFRELQFADGPQSGKPVKMFPDCSAISGIFDPNASCIAGKETDK